MEGSKQDLNSRVTVLNNEGNQGFSMLPRVENRMSQVSQQGGQTMVGQTMGGSGPQVNMGGVNTYPEVKKKMGRPRKYDRLNSAAGGGGGVAGALSPMPISASIPLTGDFSGWKQPRARPYQTNKKAHKVEFESVGDRLGHIVGANFTPSMIHVNAGEDIAMKILSLSQQESRVICVLAASGSIANVTLRQPNSSGGTLTYEGRFEIVSLSGSFMPTDNGIVKSRSGGISVSLAGPDGRVFGGGLAGLLIAATPVQVVLGSFLAGHRQEVKPKRRIEPVTPTMPAVSNQVSDGGAYGGQNLNFASPNPSFHTNNLPSVNSTHSTISTQSTHLTHLTHPMHSAHSTQHNPMDLEADHNISSPEGDSDDDHDLDDDDHDSPSNLEISG